MIFADKLAQIERRGTAIRERLLQLGSQKRQHAVAATDSDQRALAAILEVDAECNRLNSELLVLDDAKAELARSQEAAAAEAAKADQRRREQEARQLIGELQGTNHQADVQMIQLRQVLDHRHQLLRQLIATKTLSEPYLQRLQGKFVVTSALRAAGLDKHASIEFVPVGHIAPLVDAGPTRPLAAPIVRFKPKQANDAHIG
jgi:hypothetical protein